MDLPRGHRHRQALVRRRDDPSRTQAHEQQDLQDRRHNQHLPTSRGNQPRIDAAPGTVRRRNPATSTAGGVATRRNVSTSGETNADRPAAAHTAFGAPCAVASYTYQPRSRTCPDAAARSRDSPIPRLASTIGVRACPSALVSARGSSTAHDCSARLRRSRPVCALPGKVSPPGTAAA